MTTVIEELSSQGHEVEMANPSLAPYTVEWPTPDKRIDLVVWCKTHKEIEMWPLKEGPGRIKEGG